MLVKNDARPARPDKQREEQCVYTTPNWVRKVLGMALLGWKQETK